MSNFAREAIAFLTQRKQAYVGIFAPGMAGHLAFVDLGKWSNAFDTADRLPEDRDAQLIMQGRREAFWRLYNHVNLNEIELAAVYKAVVVPTGD